MLAPQRHRDGPREGVDRALGTATLCAPREASPLKRYVSEYMAESPSDAYATLESSFQRVPREASPLKRYVSEYMAESPSDAYATLESSSQGVPNFRSHKTLPRHREELRSIIPDTGSSNSQPSDLDDDETCSQVSSESLTPLASPGALKGADTGLPPTPPSNSQDDNPPASFSAPAHADGVVSSLMSKSSSLSTPVNQRSPPTPDPSPPRTTESAVSRPSIFAYPSSRAESFMTAREEISTDATESRANTPSADRLSTVNEERGLGLAFERTDSNATPINRVRSTLPDTKENSEPPKQPLEVGTPPQREWDPVLMRNVTIRKKRNPRPSPQKNRDSLDTVTAAAAAAASPGSPSSHRGRIAARRANENPPSMESFARSIGWPTEPTNVPAELPRPADNKRFSASSMTSTVVEAMVIVKPPQPQRRRTLRHSGKNLAYRRGEDSSTDHSSSIHSNRGSLNLEDSQLHRLVHKRASIGNPGQRVASDSATIRTERTASPAAYTLAHQESVRNVLQPAALIMSRSNSVLRPYGHKRISSAPEATRMMEAPSRRPRAYHELSPPQSPREAPVSSTRPPVVQRTQQPTFRFVSHRPSPSLSSVQSKDRPIPEAQNLININKSLPDLPEKSTDGLVSTNEPPIHHSNTVGEGRQTPVRDAALEMSPQTFVTPPSHKRHAPDVSPKREDSSGDLVSELVPVVRRGSLSSRGRSEERRRSSTSRDRTLSSETNPRPSLDRVPTEESPHRSYEWRSLHPDDTRRVSFDAPSPRSEEHALARHLFATGTPFSQFSDTPIEVSEATAVSIYPHNNHSLLVVQQVARSSTLPLEQREVLDDHHIPSSDAASGTASAFLLKVNGEDSTHASQPTLTIEPSTPPMQLLLPAPSAVDSPLKNPRAAPEPPVIKFIPPTPAEELERQLGPNPTIPGPPTHSDSHPQRRLSLVQRARRYSDNLISPLLARASSTSRGRNFNDHENPRVPSVGDEAGTLHPFWRPRGFWDGFEDSDSEDEESRLPKGGDTSDVEEEEEPGPEPGKVRVLGRRLTTGVKAAVIGNVGGPNGGNRRRESSRGRQMPRRLSVASSSPSKSVSKTKTKAPKILIQRPTFPLRSQNRSPRVEKRSSQISIQSRSSSSRNERSLENMSPRPGMQRRHTWRDGKSIPGVKLQVQYIGLSGVKERFRERKAEKRREGIRRSIGARVYHEGGPSV